MNERQLEMLRRIGAVAGSVTSADSMFATTVYALRNRGLVTTPRVPGGWRAEITGAGQFYLEHGHHPDRPAAVPKRKKATAETCSTLTITSAELMEKVRAAGGNLTIEDPTPTERAGWRRAIDGARRSEIPGAGRLTYLGRDSGNLYIILPRAEHASSAAVVPGANSAVPRSAVVPVEVPRRLPASPHPVVATIRDNPEIVSVTDALLRRVLRIVQAIAVEAERRGYQLIMQSSGGVRRPCVIVRDFRHELVIGEEYERPKRPKRTAAEREGPWRARRIPDPIPTGRIWLSLNNERTWEDSQRWKLEDKLGEVFAAIELRVLAGEARLAEHERERAERQARWEIAMANARADFAEHRRRYDFADQLQAWRDAGEIRRFCTALGAAADISGDVEQRQRVQKWIAWAAAYADDIDPVCTLANVADLEFNPEPDTDDLRQYLQGWSPYGPG